MLIEDLLDDHNVLLITCKGVWYFEVSNLLCMHIDHIAQITASRYTQHFQKITDVPLMSYNCDVCTADASGWMAATVERFDSVSD